MIQDTKAKDLLSSVGKDVSQLKRDMATLLSHTRRNTIPDAAKELRESAKNSLHAGGHYAASQLSYIRSHPAQSSAGILGGLLLLGAAGAGIYYLCKCDRKSCGDEATENEDSGS